MCDSTILIENRRKTLFYIFLFGFLVWNVIFNASGNLLAAELVGIYQGGPGLACDVLINKGFAYVANGANDLQVVDISDPSSPQFLYEWTQPGNESYSLAIKNDYLFLAERAGGVHIFYLEPDGFPTWIANFDPLSDDFSRASNLALIDDTLLIGDFFAGIVAVDISNPQHPVELDRLQLPEGAPNIKEVQGIAVSEGYAFVANPWGGMAIVDVSDQANLTQVGYYARPAGCFPGIWDVVVNGHVALLMCQGLGVHVIDISTPELPVLLKEILFDDGSVPYGNDAPPLDAIFMGRYAFVSNGHDGIYVLDLANSEDPTIVEHIDLPEVQDENLYNYNYAWGMDNDGHHLYVASGRTAFYVYDISAYASVAEVSIFEPEGTKGIQGVVVDDGIVYMTDRQNDLRIVDMQDPANGIEIGRLDLLDFAESFTLVKHGSYVFLARRESGVAVLDVSDPSQPFLVANIDTIDRASALALGYPYLYIGDAAGEGYSL